MEAFNKDPAIHFTDEKYAKKDEVRKELNTSLIDPIWEKIVNYRRNFYHEINLYNISHISYYFTNNNLLKNSLNEITSLLGEIPFSISDFDDMEKEKFTKTEEENIIKLYALSNGEYLKDDFLKKIMISTSNEIVGLSENKKKIFDYALSYKKIKFNNVINKEYLTYLYSLLSNKNVENVKYRDFDFDSSYQKVLINNEYNGAPFALIDDLMNNYFSFVNSNDLSNVLKAIISFYYIYFIKPFKEKNNELALLIFKSLIVPSEYSYYFPFEEILLSLEKLELDFKEANKTGDLTYTFLSIFKIIKETIENLNKDINSISVILMEEEHQRRLEDNENSNISKENVIKSEENLTNEIEKNKEEITIPNFTLINDSVDNNKEIISDNVNTKKENTKLDLNETNNKEKIIDINTTLPSYLHDVINTLTSSLNEEDAIKFENYLLQRNPLLKRNQAHFYARHCTLNCYYTIQMFKNFEHVVYETARTSMDSLVKFGYYKKEQIKNKFVYTPNKKED